MPGLIIENQYGEQSDNTVLQDASFNGHKITHLADPSSLQDAATKKYVDEQVGGGTVFRGLAAAIDFSGSPKKCSIVFSGDGMPSTNYVVKICGVDARSWTYDALTKHTTGFVINSNASADLTGEVSWEASEIL